MAGVVAVVDHGMGNLRSVAQAVAHAARETGHACVVTGDADAVRAAERIVLPGQGAMRDVMAALDRAGLREAVLDAAASKPLLGVCVGMQMLMQHSEEQDTPGLGLFAGAATRFRLDDRRQPDGSRYKVPHIGWNGVRQGADAAGRRHALWQGVPDGTPFYFVHSFQVQADMADERVGETTYGIRFTSAVARDNIFATQFHPEKSAVHGLRLYRNFLGWVP